MPRLAREGGAGRWWVAALVGGAAAGVIGWRVGARPEAAVWLLLVPVAVVLAAVDLRVFRLPDVLTLPAAGGTAALLGAASLLPRQHGSWTHALLGAAVLAAFYGLLFLISPAGMGLGDVKLALTLGLVLGWSGWRTVVTGTFAGFLAAGLVAAALLVARKADRKTALPFGPAMLFGALVGLALNG
ncbi:prepilin peptidase [Mangrovactinospora gilvigrisea]|uniref:prepilin peptidase n=1 Tax=Mangrovactinospora gilvigrisea TaxID=1428644 RepID=UPI003AF3ED4D